MRNPRIPRAGVVLALGFVLATAGCGVAIQTSAQPITVPHQLFKTPTIPPIPHHSKPIDVYFLTRGHLIASTRYVEQGRISLEQQLQDALNELSAGPTTSELRSGLSTAMNEFPPAQLTLAGNVRHGVASVYLDSSFGLLDATELFDAGGQIVYTLTQFPQVQGVSLFFGGLREAFLGGGRIRYTGTVHRGDYQSIHPLAT